MKLKELLEKLEKVKHIHTEDVEVCMSLPQQDDLGNRFVVDIDDFMVIDAFEDKDVTILFVVPEAMEDGMYGPMQKNGGLTICS